MPVVSKFYGIVIRLLTLRGLKPRVSAIYQDQEMVVDVESLRVVGGEGPERMRTLVVEWIIQNRAELMRAAGEAKRAGAVSPIRPLV